MRDLLKYLKPCRGKFTLSIFFMLGFAILSSISLSLIAPFLQSIFYDQSLILKNDILDHFTKLIIGETKWETIIRLQIVLVSIFLIKGLFYFKHSINSLCGNIYRTFMVKDKRSILLVKHNHINLFTQISI